jgi:signal transduction histidine kinase
MQRVVSSNGLVLAGFAALLVLMGALAVDAARQARDVSTASSELRKGARDRDALLDQLRSDTYHSATLVRDYLLERSDQGAARQRTELLALRSRVSDTLGRYLTEAPASERKTVRSLKGRTESYWNTMAPALGWSGSARREQGALFLQSVVLPGRDELVQLERQISALDVRTLDGAEDRIQLVQIRFRRQVSTISIIALVFGGILAAVVFRHVRRLDGEAAHRFYEVSKAREDLKRLSGRLVALQEEERRKLSRELHDDLGQAMSAMLVELGRAESMGSHGEGVRHELASVRRLAEESVAKIRNMALLLRPAMLDELGLVSALRWHVKEVGRRASVKVRLIADELNENLPDAHRTGIYRVVQEALNNCVKHSRANEVRVLIQRDGGGLSVSVQDDGVGFQPQQDKGLGLLGMMERVSALGGRFHIESQPGRGAVISTYFPLAGDQCRAEEESVA